MSHRTGERAVVAIVGAGFSGLLTALHLLADPDGPQVRLIEQRGGFGRGLAYSTHNPDHLLNVRVTNMSAFPDDPGHFVRWLATHGGWRATGAFVTRGVYGDYLQSLLRAAVDGAYGVDRLLLELDEAVDVQRADDHWLIHFAMGRQIAADAVVLAIGGLSPSAPSVADANLVASARYVGDPWRLKGLPDDLGERVLLLGAGLTMVDMALTLSTPDRRLVALSRRGLLPNGHTAAPPGTPQDDFRGSPVRVLRQIRALAKQEDWRAVIDRVRGSAPALWMSWTQAQRRSFLRHLRPWWDVHRHRMAPPVARRIADMRKSGELDLHAGHLQRLTLQGEEVRVEWRPRGAKGVRSFVVDAVVNCTGDPGDVRRSGRPLVSALLNRDLLRPDPCALGVDVDARCRPLDTWGAPSPGFYAVGPLTRAAFWEITSVPDIRHQAQAVAADVATAVGQGVAAIRSPAARSHLPS